MPKYAYYLEDTYGITNPKDKLLIRFDTEKGGIFRYDPKKKQWTKDDKMAKIFYGGIEVKVIDKKEADRLIREVY